MKRKSDGYEHSRGEGYGSLGSKRQKQDGYNHNSSGMKHSHSYTHIPKQEPGRQQPATKPGGTHDGHASAVQDRNLSQTIPDPIASLQTILQAIESSPKTESQLGASGLKHTKGLLKALQSQDKSAKTSLDLFLPAEDKSQLLPAYYAGQHLRNYPLPDLPHVPEGPLSVAPFTHKSFYHVGDRNAVLDQLDYESLEFLGDAYIETIATRIIFARFPHLPAGRQAQVREMLVKNETLLSFSKAYGFDKRLQQVGHDIDGQIKKGNKGLGKLLADVFEAYVAAIILSDPETGFARAEKWLTELWAPILLQHYGPESKIAREADYDPNAKADLQKRLLSGKETRLDYLEAKPMYQHKEETRFFLNLYLTGWGYEKEFLGYGEGKNKVEAGNRAVMDALVKKKDIVVDAERKRTAHREQKMREREQETSTVV